MPTEKTREQLLQELTILEQRIQREVERCQREWLGERYVGLQLSRVSLPAKAAEGVSLFIKDPKNFLVYCGNAGIGKNHMIACLVEWIITNFESYRFWNEYDMLEKCRRSMNDFEYSDYASTLKYMLDDDLVVINDVGSTGWTQWREEVLFTALDLRYNSMKPTIITSNLSQEQFEQRYHQRIASRIFAKENKIIEIFDGFDYRTGK